MGKKMKSKIERFNALRTSRIMVINTSKSVTATKICANIDSLEYSSLSIKYFKAK